MAKNCWLSRYKTLSSKKKIYVCTFKNKTKNNKPNKKEVPKKILDKKITQQK